MGLPVAFEEENGKNARHPLTLVLSSSPSYVGIFTFHMHLKNVHLHTELKPLGMVESLVALSSNI